MSVNRTAITTLENLGEENTLLRNILETMGEAFISINKDWRFTYINGQASELSGMKAEDFLGKVVWDVFPGLEETTFGIMYRKAMEEQVPVYFQEEYAALNIWVDVRVFPNPDGISVFYTDITAQKSAEKTSAKKEKRFRSLLENSEEVCAIFTPDAKVLYITPGIEKLIGYTEREAKDFDLLSLVDPDDLPLAKTMLEDVMEKPNRKTKPFILRVKHKDRSWRHLESILSNKLDDPAIGGIIDNIRDVTDNVMAEKKIRESEEKYRLLFDSSPLPKWIYDAHSLRIMEANPAAAEHYGFARDEFLKLHLQDIRPKSEVPQLMKMVATIREKENHFAIANHKKKNGEIMNVEVLGYPVTYQGKTARMVIVNDVTAMKKTQAELLKSYARFTYVAKATSDAIWDKNIADDFINWSEGFFTLFGYELTDANKKVSFWRSKIHPKDESSVAGKIRAALKDPACFSWVIEYRFLKSDGQYAYVKDKAVVLRNAAGLALSCVGASQDITDLRQQQENLLDLNNQLNQRAEELAVSNAELEQFAYVASHDLQEPLRMVTGFLSQLEKKYSAALDEKARQYIFYAIDGATRMRTIILDLLDYSRFAKMDFDVEGVDIQALLDEIMELNKSQLAETGAIVKYRGLPVIKASRIPMRHVFQNLVTNALKYRSPQKHPVIEVGAHDNGTNWVFSVSDNGIGIEPQFYEKIFVLFQRLHHREEYSGTGIGLAVCKKIIENHGGKIWVDSIPGKGSIFYFSLPKK
ncbi:MAG: domain S-box [Ferruginibacter sp.]|nr:domain S-box [Ferruginibacter sp.]